jgi:YegS/Rv2252/BmrU family lipid kinase
MSIWWVVVNPSAGRGLDLEARARSALERAGVAHTVRISHSAAHVAGIIAEGRANGVGRFAAVGGDGTAHLVANGILALDWESIPTLAVLPAGSGSDFVRSFNGPESLDASARRLAGDATSVLDVGLLEGRFGRRYFINAANAGIAARTVIEAERMPDRLGPRRYLAGFWLALAKTHPADIRIRCDGAVVDGLAWNVVIANGRYFGGAMNVAPDASTNDGAFDVQVFGGTRRSAPAIIRRVIRGTHLTHRAVRRLEGANIAVEVPDDWAVEADGEIVGKGPFTAAVVRNRLLYKV